MKTFTFLNLMPWDGGWKIQCEKKDLIYSPLEWQIKGLQQTKSGYGKKITSWYSIYFQNRKYRIYVTIYSNNGTAWFKTGNQKIIVDAI